ncbi:hypothetical protein EPA93_41260 [Ktedonosporobacter rubrisoli]|uniref:Blue (type 1) copper domain-containing protein n=1 Tax=Ktedonosporobacter rubrisoli TaxID=2509675 RepID=A0A4P6K1J9_KTERU|nr:plastocyanin/azurin family copper-binding protein [Ktedonosporobacter rubrisoli]QBD82067.1 hypothetical protein EPA93_41260 [Ktedonosporobacter rubrisoli]
MYKIISCTWKRRPWRFVPLCLLALSLALLFASCGGAGTAYSSGSIGNTAAATTTPDTAAQANSSDNSYRVGSGQQATSSASNTTGATSTVAVKMINQSAGSFGFSPTTLTIARGTTVVWTNATDVPHTVTSDDGKTFDSGINTPINAGATFKFTFTKTGKFSYHCQIHPTMVGSIIVK